MLILCGYMLAHIQTLRAFHLHHSRYDLFKFDLSDDMNGMIAILQAYLNLNLNLNLYTYMHVIVNIEHF